MQNRLSGFSSAVLKNILLWMDGSLFFRFLSGMFNFIGKVASGSFILGLFLAKETKNEPGIFEKLLDRILNNKFKPFVLPESWPKFLADLFSKSFVISRFCDALNTPLPKPGKSGFYDVFMWAMYAFPAWGLVMVVALTPVLPTMTIAMLLAVIVVFTFLSRKLETGRFTVVLFLFMFVNFFAAFTSFTVRESIEIAILVSVFISVSILVPVFANKREAIGLCIAAFLCGAALAGLVGLYQYLAGYTAGAWIDEVLQAYITFRVFSTFENANMYGIYLLLAIPMAMLGVVYFARPWAKMLCAALSLLLVINLFVTYSRGSYVALAFIIGVVVFLMEKRFVVLFLPALAASFFVLPQSVVVRIQSIINFQDTSTVFRLNIWEGTIRTIRDFWITGIGQGSEAFTLVYSFYALAATQIAHSHNLFFQIALELGVVGLLVFIALLSCYFRVMANFYVKAKCIKNKFMAAIFIATPMGIMLQGLFDHVFFNYRVLLSFFIFLGIGIAGSRVLAERVENCDADTPCDF